ncbi:hypothetical protein GCM10023194_77620 [Planotetraspora phitsanulokensis]|uniref:hypothetical protein n=1 Tax=Planotetraspora phitsanulokensis TaxID=575192 RepID=UPI001951AF70|nr:hypothetical protein [Planotetraspora phitsanulokensis]
MIARNLMESAGVLVGPGTREPVGALTEAATRACAAFKVEGPKNNLPFCAELLDDPEFASGDYDTGPVSRLRKARWLTTTKGSSRG